jgi:hypothetical protein
MGLAVICQLSLSGAASAATAATNTPTASTSVAPNAVNELDCNGWSAKYGTVRKLAGDTCVDPVSIKNGKAGRFSASFADGQSYSDPNVYDTCVGGTDRGGAGEGPSSPTTGLCQNATTQGTKGPVACPTNNPATGALCEFADGYCFAKGVRNTTQNFGSGPITVKEQSASNQCFANRFQNGDLDFDGLDYQSGVWPNGSSNHPTAFQYVGPFQGNGKPDPTIQFESDVGGSSALCNTATGADCTVPPISVDFYPFWSLSKASSQLAGTNCVWNFGNTLPNTVSTFGGDAQYGTPNTARYGGTIISAPMPNPQFASRC